MRLLLQDLLDAFVTQKKEKKKKKSFDLHITFYQILCRRWTKMMLTNKLDVNQRSLLKFTGNASRYILLPFPQYKQLNSLKTVAYNMTWWNAANDLFLNFYLCRHYSETSLSNYSVLLTLHSFYKWHWAPLPSILLFDLVLKNFYFYVLGFQHECNVLLVFHFQRCIVLIA